MAAELFVVDVTGNDGSMLEPDWLSRAEGVHRQLRTGLGADYAGRLRAVFANGARMSVVAEAAEVRGVALWRVIENTYEGRRLFVDDLVTDQVIGRAASAGACCSIWSKWHESSNATCLRLTRAPSGPMPTASTFVKAW